MSSARRAAGLALLTCLAATACGQAGEASLSPRRHVVLVSGRDDHGLLATPSVTLMSRPGGHEVAGPVVDGTLAEVLAVRGTQVQIRAGDVTGWVDDFSLRGELRLAGPPPTCAVVVSGDRLPAGTRVEVLRLADQQAQVRVLDRSALPGWVPAADVTERAPEPGQRCPDRSSGRSRP